MDGFGVDGFLYVWLMVYHRMCPEVEETHNHRIVEAGKYLQDDQVQHLTENHNFN